MTAAAQHQPRSLCQIGPCATVVKGWHGLQMLHVGCLLTYSCGPCIQLQGISDHLTQRSRVHLLRCVTVNQADASQVACTTTTQYGARPHVAVHSCYSSQCSVTPPAASTKLKFATHTAVSLLGRWHFTMPSTPDISACMMC